MNPSRSFAALSAAALMSLSLAAEASSVRSIRATEFDSKVLKSFENGSIDELIVEFRAGDRLPVSTAVEGDLLESLEAPSGVIGVKREFWIKLTRSGVGFSLDGAKFEAIQRKVGGSFTVAASAPDQGGPAEILSFLLRATLK